MKKTSLQSAGFTLVEMVVVMLILSVLAVTAYARISHIDSQARVAALQSFKASVLSVAAMAKGVCISDPQCAGAQGPTTPYSLIEGESIYFTHGYPVGWLGNEDGSGSLHQLINTGHFSIQTELSDATHATYYLQDAPDASHCKLEYAISPGSGTTPGLSVTTDSSGC